ncbi:hypothetical protein CYMTET_47594 [Cymbomonas tetramitiformis]|uniref:Uncharacterized protein n=1 Tax=Cymbomonas tetramitiformis TaxID=36881 RepID=A0AAE0BVR1_9CHLO|nr:hypothetical protein CYMTET_47594 [Cymbomonas tetramitiformis]|eukprot:gene514-909_t
MAEPNYWSEPPFRRLAVGDGTAGSPKLHFVDGRASDCKVPVIVLLPGLCFFPLDNSTLEMSLARQWARDLQCICVVLDSYGGGVEDQHSGCRGLRNPEGRPPPEWSPSSEFAYDMVKPADLCATLGSFHGRRWFDNRVALYGLSSGAKWIMQALALDIGCLTNAPDAPQWAPICDIPVPITAGEVAKRAREDLKAVRTVVLDQPNCRAGLLTELRNGWPHATDVYVVLAAEDEQHSLGVCMDRINQLHHQGRHTIRTDVVEGFSHAQIPLHHRVYSKDIPVHFKSRLLSDPGPPWAMEAPPLEKYCHWRAITKAGSLQAGDVLVVKGGTTANAGHVGFVWEVVSTGAAGEVAVTLCDSSRSRNGCGFQKWLLRDSWAGATPRLTVTYLDNVKNTPYEGDVIPAAAGRVQQGKWSMVKAEVQRRSYYFNRSEYGHSFQHCGWTKYYWESNDQTEYKYDCIGFVWHVLMTVDQLGSWTEAKTALGIQPGRVPDTQTFFDFFCNMSSSSLRQQQEQQVQQRQDAMLVN